MIGGLIGCGIDDLSNEYDYIGPVCMALHNRMCELVESLEITEGCTGLNKGAEVIWAWVLQECKIPYNCIQPTSVFGMTGFNDYDKEIFHLIKIAGKTCTTLATGNVSPEKQENADLNLVVRCDVVIIACAEITSRFKTAIERCRKLDKEIILLKVNELL